MAVLETGVDAKACLPSGTEILFSLRLPFMELSSGIPPVNDTDKLHFEISDCGV